jgi:tungstate transport system ATP-binding protein
MSGAAVFSLCDVGMNYGRGFQLAIDQLDVSAGETLGLIGPTGAGKSTLMKLLAGLESPSRGEIRFDGDQRMTRDAPLDVRRRVVMVHQWPVLLRGTVRMNIEHGLRLRGAAKPYMDVPAVMDLLDLAPLAERQARTLSAGQTQLVAMARALVVSPDVLLLDEPTGSLDPAHVALVERAVQTFRERRPMTIVWATHNLFQARRVAQRVAFLWNGKLIEAAETEAIFDRPGDPRTADFVNGRLVY